MNRNVHIKQDLEDLVKRFPKLRYSYDEKQMRASISGMLEICDAKGNYWKSFNILITVGPGYPYEVPKLKEKSDNIPRQLDRHITKEGDCCVDIPHKLKLKASRGIRLTDFVLYDVYPFFANQLYFDEEHIYANGEWTHNFQGIREFYQEELGIINDESAISILVAILDKRIPERNDLCICGKKKFKKCHLDAVRFLSCLGETRLREDLSGFRNSIK